MRGRRAPEYGPATAFAPAGNDDIYTAPRTEPGAFVTKPSEHADPHILLVPSWYPSEQAPLSGTFFREQAEALAGLGMKVGVIAPHIIGASAWLRAGRPSLSITRSEENGVQAYRKITVPAVPRFSRRNAWFWMSAGRKLYDAYVRNQGRPDLIHAHGVLYGGLLARRLKAGDGTPLVITEHSSAFARSRPRRWMTKAAAAAFAEADARLVVSPTLGALLTAQFAHRFCPWQTVPNVLDAGFEASIDDKPPTDPGRVTFLCVGNLLPIKGQDLLIAAFARRFRDDRSASLRLVGAGAMEAAYRRTADNLGVGDQVTFVGPLDRSAVRREMLAADALVLPTYYDTFGVVVIEALACGTPVIATTGSGPQSIVDADNGLLVPPGDVEALAEALSDMRRTRDRYEPAALREACLARYGQDAVGRTLLAVYDAILHDCRTGDPDRRIRPPCGDT